MKEKILQYIDRLHVVEEALGDPEVVQDQAKFRELTQEHSRLNGIKATWDGLESAKQQLKDNEEMLRQEADEEFVRVLEDDIAGLTKTVHDLNIRLENLLVPPDPNDNRNTIMELRAGTGGAEAALFVANCVRMYKLYADFMGWNYELLSCTPSEMGGFKEYVMVLSGPNVHRQLKYEAGTHRVQRVPETEAQGRVHTSAITVAVLTEPSREEVVDVDERDLRIDTFRSSGAGGQHVNTTDSAVRITHIPTGIVAACQEERSQHKNREKAMRFLSAKLAEQKRLEEERARASTRSAQVGTGDRSERIRTYNFPQNRLTDHRINLTLYSLEQVMNGELEEVTSTLVKHFHHQKLMEAE
ncbi:MAG: Peptide chain release factor 1 [Chlamydiae bacterium]|nr:Peptide chain release factor 1 [Chlamydiota bacterium]